MRLKRRRAEQSQGAEHKEGAFLAPPFGGRPVRCACMRLISWFPTSLLSSRRSEEQQEEVRRCCGASFLHDFEAWASLDVPATERAIVLVHCISHSTRQLGSRSIVRANEVLLTLLGSANEMQCGQCLSSWNERHAILLRKGESAIAS